MLRIGKDTTQRPQDVLAKATSFFGPGGTGLKVIPRGPHTLAFTGGGGFVLVHAKPKDKGSEIDIQTREWDYDARRFLRPF